MTPRPTMPIARGREERIPLMVAAKAHVIMPPDR
jgi:hypothetical protein